MTDVGENIGKDKIRKDSKKKKKINERRMNINNIRKNKTP